MAQARVPQKIYRSLWSPGVIFCLTHSQRFSTEHRGSDQSLVPDEEASDHMDGDEAPCVSSEKRKRRAFEKRFSGD